MSNKNYNRQQSIESQSSYSTQNGDDVVLKDCFDLRQKLIETEKSLQSLYLNTPSESLSYPCRVFNHSPTSDNPPMLTLADLTPTASNERGSNNIENRNNSMLLQSSLTEIQQRKRISPSTMSCFNSNSLNDVNSSRMKISNLREENSILFLQNNKLMTQLENATYQLHQCKEEIKTLSKVTSDESNLRESKYGETFKLLEEQVDKKQYAIKELENLIVELRQHLRDKDEENQIYSERLLTENEEHACTINELTKKIEELEELCHKHANEVDDLKIKNNDLINVKSTLENDHRKVSERNNNLNTENLKIHQELVNTREDILTMQQKTSEAESFQVENLNLKVIIENQQEKLQEYENEVTKTKQHMMKLENLIQKIQEDKINESRPDSGIGIPHKSDTQPLSHSFSHSMSGQNSSRSIIADLRLKLAMKDTEINKLNSLLSSKRLNQQKIKSDLTFENCHLSSLRSELSTVMDKTRITDRKQLELEQQITGLEEELSHKTSTIVELNERICDKVTLNTALENKINMKNNDIMELKETITNIDTEHQKKQSKLQSAVKNLQAELSSFKEQYNETNIKLTEYQSLAKNYSNRIIALEATILTHKDETQQTDKLLEKIQKLHSEHCNDLEKQVDNLQEQLKTKSELIVNLESKLHNVLQDDKMKEGTMSDLQEYVSKMDLLLSEQKSLVVNYEEKLKSIQYEAVEERKKLDELSSSNNSLNNQLETLFKTLEQNQNDYNMLEISKEEEIVKLSMTINDLGIKFDEKCNKIIDLENSVSEHLIMLDENQKHISELEETQKKYLKESTKISENIATKESKFRMEITNKNTDIIEIKKVLKLYQDQNDELNGALDGAKLKLVELGESLACKDEKINEQANLMDEQAYEIESSLKVMNSIQEELDKKVEKIDDFNVQLTEKEKINEEILKENKYLKNQQDELHDELKQSCSQLQQCDNNYEEISKKLNAINASKVKLERMISIMQDEANIKEQESRELMVKSNNMQNILKQQELELKQKATQVVQLEMRFKQEKSEFDKTVSLLEQAMHQLRTSIKEKDYQISSLLHDKEALQAEIQSTKELCKEYEVKHRLHDEINMETTKELQSLKEEFNSCQVKLEEYVKLEEEISILSTSNQQMLYEVQSLESRLMASEQAVYDLTQDLQQAHNVLNMKETDCTRLARELGSSQVREAQEKTEYSVELAKVKSEKEFQSTQSSQEIENLRNKHEQVIVKQKQQILTLQLTLQRSDDENKLCKSDLGRFKHRVEELENEVKSLMHLLMVEQKKCRDIDEAMVIREAEMTRYSARLSGYERAVFKNHPNRSGNLEHTNPNRSSNLDHTNMTPNQPTNNNATLNQPANSNNTISTVHVGSSRTEVHEDNKLDSILKNAEQELNRQTITDVTIATSDISSLNSSFDFSNI